MKLKTYSCRCDALLETIEQDVDADLGEVNVCLACYAVVEHTSEYMTRLTASAFMGGAPGPDCALTGAPISAMPSIELLLRGSSRLGPAILGVGKARCEWRAAVLE